MTWQQALDSVGSQEMVRLRKLFGALPWQRLVPAQGHAIVTDSYGDDVAAALTAQTSYRRLAATYGPSTGTESRTLMVDLAQFAGSVAARWYSPTDGCCTVFDDPLVAGRIAHV